jgi:hypothetical protein
MTTRYTASLRGIAAAVKSGTKTYLFSSSNSAAISSASDATEGFFELDFSLAAIFSAARCEHL